MTNTNIQLKVNRFLPIDDFHNLLLQDLQDKFIIHSSVWRLKRKFYTTDIID